MNEPNLKVTWRKLTFGPGFRKLNPQLFGMGPVEDPKRKPSQWSQSQDRPLEASQKSLGYRVTIISVRRRLVDAHDNLRTGAKPLVDAITATLGFRSDDDARLRWQYGQCETRGEEGTIVRVEEMPLQ